MYKLLAAAITGFVTAKEHSPEFSSWMLKFQKAYELSEIEHRRATFDSNLRTIEEHNAKHAAGKVGWTMALNQFSDLTAEEFSKVYLRQYKRSRPLREVWLPNATDDSVDWRTKGAVTPVKNQGQCGSCWSFSTTGSTEGAWAISGHNLTSLSEQQLMDCSTSEGDHSCEGGLMDYGFEYIIKNGGIDTEADYPYKMKDESCDHTKEKAIHAQLASYADVPGKQALQLEAAIAKGPVSVAIEADQSGFQHYSTGIFSGECGTKLDHGVLAVGYTQDYWIVKNSWGETWGDQGYVMLSRTVGTPAGNQCGIMEQPSYPVAHSGTIPPTAPTSAPPTPGPTTGNLVISGAGTADCNGVYTKDGNTYTHTSGNYIISFLFETWRLEETTGAQEKLYQETGGVGPTDGTWTTIEGQDPAPTVKLQPKSKYSSMKRVDKVEY